MTWFPFGYLCAAVGINGQKFFLAEISEIWYNTGKGIIDRRKYIWNILLMQKFLADFITVL